MVAAHPVRVAMRSHAAIWFQLVEMRLTNLRSGLGRGKAEAFLASLALVR